MKTKYLFNSQCVIECYDGFKLCAYIVAKLDSFTKLPSDFSISNISLTPSYFRYWIRTVLAIPFTDLVSLCKSQSFVDDDELSIPFC